MESSFIHGLDLSKSFYHEIVKRIIEEIYPDLKYSAALIGRGSEVLGFDDFTSMDHHWGPRLMIFLTEEDYNEKKELLNEAFSTKLPNKFKDFSTNWSKPDEYGNQFMEYIDNGPINHRIQIFTVSSFMEENLGINSLELEDKDWMIIHEQRLLEFTSGEIFHDSLGELTKARNILNYFPEHIWKYKMYVQWNKIANEMAFVGRA